MKTSIYACVFLFILLCFACDDDDNFQLDATLRIESPLTQTSVAVGEPVEFIFSTSKTVPSGYTLTLVNVLGKIFLPNESFTGQSKTLDITFTEPETEFLYGVLTNGEDTLLSNIVEITIGCSELAVTLESISSDDNLITLQWTKSEASNFARYVIYRNQFGPPTENNSSDLILITDQNQTSYTDEVELMDRNFYYAVVVETVENCQTFSNVETIEPGTFVRLEQPLNKILVDPSRDYVYAISDESNILAIDMNTMEVVADFSVGYSIEDMDISPDHQYLYFSPDDINQKQIIQLKLPGLSLARTIPTEEIPFKIEVGPNYIYYQRRPPTSGSSPIKRIEIATNSESGFSTSRHGDIELSSDGKYLFHVEGNTSNATLIRIETNFGNRIIQDRISDFNAPNLALAGNDAFLFHSDRVYDKDLNLVGMTTDQLYAISSDGSLVLHHRQEVLNTSDFSKAFTAPAIYQLGAFGKDDAYVVLYVAPSNSYKVDGKLFRVDL